MAAALKFYDKVTEFPPKDNPVYGYALYKTAWTEFNLEDYRGSLAAFVQTIEFADQHPEVTDAKALAQQSRKEMVAPYARVGSPSRALAFFRRYARSADEAYGMLERLADTYYDNGDWDSAIAVYHQLISDRPTDDKVCHWQVQVANAVVSSKPKDAQLEEVRRSAKLYEQYAKAPHPKDDIAACQSDTASLMIWLATAWHREAVGKDGSPGTHDKSTMQRAAQLYRLLLATFPDLDQVRFPSIDRRDWPTRYSVAYYYAELLWNMQDWGQCGPAFDKVVELDPHGAYTSDAAYAAVLCYNNLYQQQYQPRQTEASGGEEEAGKKGGAGAGASAADAARFAPRAFTPLEEGMLRAFSRYVCYVDKSDADMAQIKYRRARIYYEANHFEEAAVLFRDVAFNYPNSDLAEYAANLYLDCLNILGTERSPAKVACVQQIENELDPLRQQFCSTPEAADAHEDLCGSLAKLQCQVRRKQAEAYQSNKEFKRAAAMYVRIFRRNQQCGAMDEVLYDAAINFEAARLLGRAIQVRKVLIARYPDSPLAKRALFLVGANYHALAFYDQAARYYEEFATRFPGELGKDCTAKDRRLGVCAVAPDALRDAVFFRLGLSDDTKAIADAELFEKNYRRRMPIETARVVFSVSSIYVRRKQWDALISYDERFLARYRGVATPDLVIEAEVALGRALRERGRRGDDQKATRYLRAAAGTFDSGVVNRIARDRDLSETERAKAIHDALDGAAEARFLLAESDYEAFQAIAFPRYSGPRSKDRIDRWAKRDFKRWVTKKLAALKKAEAAYGKVAALKVTERDGTTLRSAPWQIAAAARVGLMYRTFVDSFRDAPIPKSIERDPQLYDIYVGALDEQSEPLQKLAIERFEFCLKTATNVRWFNRWSRTCEQELHELNPRRYPLAAELRGAPSYVSQTFGEPRPITLDRATVDEALGDEGEKP